MEESSLYTGGNDDGTFVPFTDILFNALLGFAFMVFIAFSLINPTAKTGTVDMKAEVIITATWPDGNADDVDLMVEDPAGNIAWYKAKEIGLMHLDRDDRGATVSHTMTVNGQTVQSTFNQEVVTLRGNVPGEYVVSVFDFANDSKAPVPVSVKVEKVNPTVTVLYYGTLTLDRQGDEKTAVRFTLDDQGTMKEVNNKPKSLVRSIFGDEAMIGFNPR